MCTLESFLQRWASHVTAWVVFFLKTFHVPESESRLELFDPSADLCPFHPFLLPILG